MDSLIPIRSALRAFVFSKFLSPFPKLLKSPSRRRIDSGLRMCSCTARLSERAPNRKIMTSANHHDFVVQNRRDIKMGPPILYHGFRRLF